jgi:uncharacterized protein
VIVVADTSAIIAASGRRARVLGTARLVQNQYAGLDLDLADAVNVGLAARYGTDAMLTLDRRDLRAVRPLTSHRWFRLLPDDLEH